MVLVEHPEGHCPCPKCRATFQLGVEAGIAYQKEVDDGTDQS